MTDEQKKNGWGIKLPHRKNMTDEQKQNFEEARNYFLPDKYPRTFLVTHFIDLGRMKG